MEIEINGKTLTVRHGLFQCEHEIANDDTGLNVVWSVSKTLIDWDNQTISTEYKVHDITPTGQRINRRTEKYITPYEDGLYFDAVLGAPIKMYSSNGMIRKMGIAWGIFNAQGQQVTTLEAPVVEEEPENQEE